MLSKGMKRNTQIRKIKNSKTKSQGENYMKKIVAGSLSAVVAIGLTTACAPQTNVETGAKNNVQSNTVSAQSEVPKKKIKPNFSQDFKYIKLNIAEISISPDEIDVGLNYQNNSSKKIDWYPENGHVIIGDMQLNVDPLTQTNLVTGTIDTGTKSDGILVFKPQGNKKIDINKVDNLKFDLDQIIPDDLDGSTKKVEFEIPVK